MPCTLKDIKMVVSYDDTTIFYFVTYSKIVELLL